VEARRRGGENEVRGMVGREGEDKELGSRKRLFS
jgi:hypothetical protein